MMTPKETDTKLAAMWHELHETERRIGGIESTIMHLAGARYYYRGRHRVTDMTLDEALDIVENAVDEIAAYRATHSVTEPDGYVSTNWNEYKGVVPPYDKDKPAKYLAEREAQIEARDAKLAEIMELEATYTGWSRFFLVTSSAGHVHSSMHCSTCYPRTTYGWLPELSGQSESDAVDELGPTLCSVCFPSAPVDWTNGKKMTAAAAAKRAA